MWNSFNTAGPLGLTAEITTYKGWNGDEVHAYVARTTSKEPRGGIVVVHHLPGFDEFYMEFTERLARHGYDVILPDLYCRFGHGEPADVSTKVRADGGVPDPMAVGDIAAAVEWLRALPTNNGKVGLIGGCSGGRHVILAAGQIEGLNAVVDLWGGNVIMAPDALSESRPVAPVDYTENITAPILGLFGNDDQSPTPDQVDQHEAELRRLGKDYEFFRYDGAGHTFFTYSEPRYRQAQAMDGWEKVFAFFATHL